MENSPIIRGRRRPRKTMDKTVKKDLYLNGLSINMIYDRIQWCLLIHVANPT